MAKTKIEWAERVWNPVTGCTKVSQGCKNCYAERMAKRLAGRAGYPEAPNQFQVTLHPERLKEPLRWKEPGRVFVDSMSDLFHPDIPDLYIYYVFDIMAQAENQTFLVLTKRADRMRDFCQRLSLVTPEELKHLKTNHCSLAPEKPKTYQVKPLPNVWLGVSVEDQNAVNKRYGDLLETPAAKRFISYEPALGPIHLLGSCKTDEHWFTAPLRGGMIDWVICGGESGPGARPMHPDWARNIREQCQTANVSFLFKQWGEWLPYEETASQPLWYSQDNQYHDANVFMPDFGLVETEKHWDDGLWAFKYKLPVIFERVGKKAAGRLLDGMVWDEYPKM